MDVSGLGTESEVLAYLGEHALVSINSGAPYGEEGKGHIRIVHGVFSDNQVLEEAVGKMRKALFRLAKEKGLCE